MGLTMNSPDQKWGNTQPLKHVFLVTPSTYVFPWVKKSTRSIHNLAAMESHPGSIAMGASPPASVCPSTPQTPAMSPLPSPSLVPSKIALLFVILHAPPASDDRPCLTPVVTSPSEHTPMPPWMNFRPCLCLYFARTISACL